ncbi:TonB-dependent receptor domain-containing protein [Fibrella aquatica]|uniref:TonB-dependent receptor domain-containing protein n=1 Tax=Fibrella aquatica TaxID=3242487 RepID=UPI0035202E81
MLILVHTQAQTPDSLKKPSPLDSSQPASTTAITPFTTPQPRLISTRTGQLTGTLIDGGLNKPVEFATVALYNPLTNKPIGGTTSDEQGKFVLNNVAPGTYRVVASFMGYETKTLDNITLRMGQPPLALGVISMRVDSRTLNEVVITSEKPLIEDKDDRMVYNAEKDLTNSGGTAMDVLKKVPLLTIDPDGTVQMKGSSSIKVLINGKPSSLMARSINEALQMIPSELIKSVEVITAPSAKYDSEGTAGVINIITKSKLQGITGGLTGTLGNRQNPLNGNLNMKREKLSLTAFGGGNWTNSYGRSENVRRNLRNGELFSVIEQSNAFSNEGKSVVGSLSVDYDLDSTNRLGVDVNLGGDNRTTYSTRDTRQSVDSDRAFRRYTTTNGENSHADMNVNYTRLFKRSTEQEYTFLAQYNQNDGLSGYRLTQFPLPETELINYREQNRNENRQNELTLQTDYSHPFSTTKQRLLEIGTKLIRRDVGSNFRLETSPDGSVNFRDDPRRANMFDYQQAVWSSYASFRMRTAKNWSINLGGRFEVTMIDADFKSTKTQFSDDYNNFLPNVSVSKRIGKSQRIRMNYSQRIQRPSIAFLNPYINSADPKNIQSGNPFLEPELAHLVEWAYSTYTKSGTTVNLMLFSRQTNNAIERVTTVDTTGVSTSTYRNIASNATYGTNLFGSVKPVKGWNLSGSVALNYNILNSPALRTSNRNWSYQLNMNTSVQLPKNTSLQANGSYRSRQILLQGQSAGYYYYGFSARKELKPHKITLTATFENPFRVYNIVSNQLTTATFLSEGTSYTMIRNIRLTANWRFGKMSAGPKREKKKIVNDDKKPA